VSHATDLAASNMLLLLPLLLLPLHIRLPTTIARHLTAKSALLIANT